VLDLIEKLYSFKHKQISLLCLRNSAALLNNMFVPIDNNLNNKINSFGFTLDYTYRLWHTSYIHRLFLILINVNYQTA